MKTRRKPPALSPTEREVLQRFRALVEARGRLHDLILFGSRA